MSGILPLNLWQPKHSPKLNLTKKNQKKPQKKQKKKTKKKQRVLFFLLFFLLVSILFILSPKKRGGKYQSKSLRKKKLILAY